MQILLKQAEIVAALKQYIAAKGIDINGKTFEVGFTAGRKDSGLSAEINIEEGNIPGFDKADADEGTKPTLTVVTNPPADAQAAAVEEATKPVSNSLFGS